MSWGFHIGIAEAIGSTGNDYKIIGDLKDSGLLTIEKKKDYSIWPIALADLIDSLLIMMYWVFKIMWPGFYFFLILLEV